MTTFDKSLTALMLVFLFPCIVNAGYVGPKEVATGAWGKADNRFTREPGDSWDTFPTEFGVLADGTVIVVDGKLKIYKDNAFYKALDLDGQVFFCDSGIVVARSMATAEQGKKAKNDKNAPVSFFDTTGELIKNLPGKTFDGTLVKVLDDCSFITSDTNSIYRKYAIDGKLIRKYGNKPLELLRPEETVLDVERYKITLRYPDKLYIITSNAEFMRYVRDKHGYIYGVNSDGLWKFNSCGKEIAELIIPRVQQEKVNWPQLKGRHLALPVEYGGPLISSNGDVYTWKKSFLKYSIIKWTWLEEQPTESGLEAPLDLLTHPFRTGIYLTWKQSSQDPGCVTEYEIIRASLSDGPFTLLTVIPEGVFRYNDTSAEPGKTYYYKVRAVAGGKASPYSRKTVGKR